MYVRHSGGTLQLSLVTHLTGYGTLLQLVPPPIGHQLNYRCVDLRRYSSAAHFYILGVDEGLFKVNAWCLIKIQSTRHFSCLVNLYSFVVMASKIEDDTNGTPQASSLSSKNSSKPNACTVTPFVLLSPLCMILIRLLQLPN